MVCNPFNVIQAWKRIPILFFLLKRLVFQSHLDNVIGLMVKVLQDFGGLGFKELGANLVNMGHYVGVACS
jgi:hypothetical protein